MSTIQTNSIQAADGHPNLATPEERLSWVLAVQKITRIFSEKTQYDFNPIALLEDQHTLVNTLRQTPSYLAAMASKPYDKIIITPPKNGFVYYDLQIKPEAIDAWKTHLKELRAGRSLEEIVTAIKDLQQAVMEQPPKELFSTSTGKLTTPPNKEDKVNNQKIYNEIKLSSNPSKEILNKWTDFKGLDEELRNKLRKNFEALDKEQQLCDLLELALVLQRKTNLDQLDAGDLIYFSDTQDVINPRLANLTGLVNPTALSLEVAKRIEKYTSQTTSAPKTTTEPITLVQQLPEVAIFRGCVGGDCSSLYSFPYPNAPSERVFFIYDDKEKLRGYVSAVEVTVNGEPALYVITISGSRVGTAEAEMILQGLEAQKKELGVEHIVLPIPDNIGSLLNFPGPKAVYEKFTKGQPTISIEYKDQELRQEIENFRSTYNTGDYDHTEINNKGVIFKQKKSQKLKVEVQRSDQKIEPTDLRQTSPAEIFELLIPMHLAGKTDTVDQVLGIEKVAQKVSKVAFEAFLTQLANIGLNLTTSEWKKNLQASLEELDIKPDFLEKEHPEFLYPGLLETTDCYSPGNIENTAKELVKDFKSNNFRFPCDFSDAILKELNNTRAFKELVSLLSDRLKNEDPNVRNPAAGALGKIKPADVSIHLALAELLKDQDWRVPISAASALGQIKPTDARTHLALVALLKNRERWVRETAASLLGEIKPADVSVHLELVELLKDQDLQVRIAAARALGKIKPADVSIHLALAKLLKDQDWGVREAATKALTQIKPTDASIHLELAKLLKDSDSDVREAAAYALCEIKPTDVSIHLALAKLLKDQDWGVRAFAALALGKIKPTDTSIHLALAELLKDPDSGVRRAATKALTQIKPTDASIHLELEKLLKDQDWDVRDAAADALHQLKPTDPSIHQTAAPPTPTPQEPSVREATAETLGAIKADNTAAVSANNAADGKIRQAFVVLFMSMVMWCLYNAIQQGSPDGHPAYE